MNAGLRGMGRSPGHARQGGRQGPRFPWGARVYRDLGPEVLVLGDTEPCFWEDGAWRCPSRPDIVEVAAGRPELSQCVRLTRSGQGSGIIDYFEYWTYNPSCFWEFAQGGWDIDGVGDLLAASHNTAVFEWRWSGDLHTWTPSIIDEWRAKQSAPFCKGV